MKNFRKWIWGYGVILMVTLASAQWGSKVVTVLAENTPPERNGIIVIDPGHGGVDGGATSCTGVLESKLNLEISLRLRDLFHFLGYQTKMIRTEDISVYTAGETIAQKKMSDLRERVRIVNEQQDTLLLSIHQNYFTDSRYSGAQVFYSDTEESRKLANEIQTALIQHLNPDSKRQEKKGSGIYLMEYVRCPAVLIECGFLSSPGEEANLRSKEYQQRLCAVIATATANYKSNT